ncbi:protein-export membrane protein SecF [Candidatus Roizmanbacteria bacterium RIFCSPLOWO2_01_FULL_38_12]|uniref:Protein-export membrane protein SecF n=1 Tax=Candidatus Roizmanbacteria bacterium RIFCSPLOWO2_01_FULL_38_12 TaxID=1802061 RepID=A0A1F7ISU4_9BACT|nr:MAG: protein-export membrane protein SecF [Candidatus Roizmanbacteria bacterium RIFCSPHIGHO2_01_FULL_38_15]OGK35824.1 MAG: protein-export membrane protein SecF [Candidatus Roizmanbacteria bacterium RIFCSPHIGHO2_12_FULL_38_13]OGK46396.1 MAG: protein-export membrane protein SecF [Candidatus Roizmanbacteria bacterium RIFCSPLOWO2_01_FULL_38_12]
MIDFLKHTRIYTIISLVVIAAGIASIILWRFEYSIDFVGGTSLEYQVDKNLDGDKVSQLIEKQEVKVQEITIVRNKIVIRTNAIDEKMEKSLRESLAKEMKTKITVLRTETVGPTIGAETVRKTLVASGIAALGILAYIAYAFKKFNFALAAIVALVHDILVVVGSYSLISFFFGAQLDTLFVTALLTTMSFSVHDTIVVFDQIREYEHRYGKGDIYNYANRALTDTMVRSLNNSMTIIFMLIALVLLGGTTIRFFAVTLLIGTITGTYSSPFIATPVAVWLESRKKK